MNTTSSTPSSGAAPEKTTNPFRRNENGKRPRPAATVRPDLGALMGSAPTKHDSSISTGGTSGYGYVVTEPKFESYQSGSGVFRVCNLAVILGMVDLTKSVRVDEATNEAIFDIPDPHEWERALQIKKESGSKDFIEVSQRRLHRLPLFERVRVSIPNASDMPGVQLGSIVRVDGLTCKSFRPKTGGDFLFGYEAKSVTLLPAVGSDPSKMLRFLEESGAFSDWYHEEPYITEEEVKRHYAFGGEHFTIVPLVRKDDDPAVVNGLFERTTADRGFVVVVRPAGDEASRAFHLPRHEVSAAKAAEEHDKSVRVPSRSDACLDFHEPYLPKASWDLVISQWDTGLHPAMGPSQDRALTYEMTVEARSQALWSVGVSHPEHWCVMAYHVPYMRGAIAFQENRKDTGAVQGNIARNHKMKYAAQVDGSDPAALGIGMKQLPRVWFRGGVLDVPEYLRRSGLRCSFAAAVVLMGHKAKDVTDPDRPLQFRGKIGEEKVTDKKGNLIKNGGTIKLCFEPEGFVCLNATQRYKNMRALDKKIRSYYALTPIVPKFEIDPSAPVGPGQGQMMSMPNARRRDAVVDKIADAEVLEICKRATRSPMDYTQLQQQFLATPEGDPAYESKRAAGEWLSCSYLSDYSQKRLQGDEDEEIVPWLVFGTFKRDADENPRVREAEETALRMAIEGWRRSPSLMFSGKGPADGGDAAGAGADADADRLVSGEAPNPAVPESRGGQEAGASEPPAKRAKTARDADAGAPKEEEEGEHQQSWQDIPSPPPLEDADSQEAAPPLPPRDDGDAEMEDADDSAEDGESEEGGDEEGAE